MPVRVHLLIDNGCPQESRVDLRKIAPGLWITLPARSKIRVIAASFVLSHQTNNEPEVRPHLPLQTRPIAWKNFGSPALVCPARRPRRAGVFRTGNLADDARFLWLAIR